MECCLDRWTILPLVIGKSGSRRYILGICFFQFDQFTIQLAHCKGDKEQNTGGDGTGIYSSSLSKAILEIRLSWSVRTPTTG